MLKTKLNRSGVSFISDTHQYFLDIDGERKQLRGITGSLMKMVFPDMYKEVPENILANAAARGNRIHDDIFRYDMAGVVVSEEAGWYADLKKKEGFEVVDSEYLVTDFKMFASAIDKLIVIDGKNYIADIKTTYKIHDGPLSWQLSIYEYMFSLINPDIKIEGLKVIWVRDGAIMQDVKRISRANILELFDCAYENREFIYSPESVIPVAQQQKALALIKQVADLAEEIKGLEAKKKEYDEQVKSLFNRYDIDKWETDEFIITRVKATKRETFDKDKLRESHPRIYKRFIGYTDVKESIRTKLKTKHEVVQTGELSGE